MIFIYLTPNPKGGHLKIIELGSSPLGFLLFTNFDNASPNF
jgi:hypothetical protein